ncbi:hypothetical protein BH11PLA1_BH11PLA1_06610 [soil metagenome]
MGSTTTGVPHRSVLAIDPTAPPPRREDLFALEVPALVARFRIGVERFDHRLAELSNTQLDRPFPASAGVGLWPCRVLVGHLADAEIAFVHRMRRVAAEEHPILAPWDENQFLDSRMYGDERTGPKFPLGAFIATIHTLRQWISEWLAVLPSEAWQRTGLHQERGEQTLRTIVEYDTFHVEHHALYLNQKVALLAAERS